VACAVPHGDEKRAESCFPECRFRIALPWFAHGVDAKVTASIVSAGGIELIVNALSDNISNGALSTNACRALGTFAINGLHAMIYLLCTSRRQAHVS
jgi:hypothetical protein